MYGCMEYMKSQGYIQKYFPGFGNRTKGGGGGGHRSLCEVLYPTLHLLGGGGGGAKGGQMLLLAPLKYSPESHIVQAAPLQSKVHFISSDAGRLPLSQVR